MESELLVYENLLTEAVEQSKLQLQNGSHNMERTLKINKIILTSEEELQRCLKQKIKMLKLLETLSSDTSNHDCLRQYVGGIQSDLQKLHSEWDLLNSAQKILNDQYDKIESLLSLRESTNVKINVCDVETMKEGESNPTPATVVKKLQKTLKGAVNKGYEKMQSLFAKKEHVRTAETKTMEAINASKREERLDAPESDSGKYCKTVTSGSSSDYDFSPNAAPVVPKKGESAEDWNQGGQCSCEKCGKADRRERVPYLHAALSPVPEEHSRTTESTRGCASYSKEEVCDCQTCRAKVNRANPENTMFKNTITAVEHHPHGQASAGAGGGFFNITINGSKYSWN